MKSRTWFTSTVAAQIIALLGACSVSSAIYAQVAAPYTSGYFYNPGGQLTGVVQPCVDGGCIAKEYVYNSAGLVSSIEEGSLSSWPTTGPSQWTWSQVVKVVNYTYDSMGRISSKEVSSSGGTPYELTQYAYDSMSRVECVAVRMNPAVGLGTGACSLTTPEPAAGFDRITYTTYDAQNNKPLVITRAYGTPNQEAYETYTYTLNGRVQTITDARGNLTTLNYGGFDRLSETEFPSATSVGASNPNDAEHYTHDNDNNMLARVTRDGQTIQYSYDALNRMYEKIAPGEQNVYYGYNLQGQRLYANFASASGQGVSDNYDGFGDLTAESVNLSGTTLTMSYGFDADGDRTQLTYPDNAYIKYVYDGLDRLSQVLESGSTVLAAYSYNAAGQLGPVTRGSGSPATALSYDGIGRLSSLTQTLGTTADDVTFSYQYNPANQIVSQNISNQAYYPLVNGSTQSYAANGLNEYSTVGGTSYSYDGRGNLQSDGSTTYTYDVENRLLSATGTDNATLTYDPLGRLYSVASGSTTTTFIYDGNRIAAEYDANGNLLQRYVYGGAGDDPIVWYEGSGFGQSNRQYLLANQQGSIIDVTDSSGNALAVNQFHPYGLGGSLNEGRFQFTGQAYIPEVGLYYYKARMYNPSLGRFMQTDPIGYTDDVDLYAYVGNDPVDKTDPTGEDAGSCTYTGDCQNFLNINNVPANLRLSGELAGGAGLLIGGIGFASSEAGAGIINVLKQAYWSRIVMLGFEAGSKWIVGHADAGHIAGADQAVAEDMAGDAQTVSREALEQVTEDGAELTKEIEKDIGRVWSGVGAVTAGSRGAPRSAGGAAAHGASHSSSASQSAGRHYLWGTPIDKAVVSEGCAEHGWCN